MRDSHYVVLQRVDINDAQMNTMLEIGAILRRDGFRQDWP